MWLVGIRYKCEYFLISLNIFNFTMFVVSVLAAFDSLCIKSRIMGSANVNISEDR